MPTSVTSHARPDQMLTGEIRQLHARLAAVEEQNARLAEAERQARARLQAVEEKNAELEQAERRALAVAAAMYKLGIEHRHGDIPADEPVEPPPEARQRGGLWLVPEGAALARRA